MVYTRLEMRCDMSLSRIFKNTIALSVNTIYAPLLFLTIIFLALFGNEHLGLVDEFRIELFSTGLGLFAVVACLHVVGCASSHRAVNLAESFLVGAVRLPSFLMAYFLVLAGVTLGGLCLLAPGIYVACRWGMAPFLVASDNLGIVDAFQRSDELSRGRLWEIFGLIVVGTLAVGGAQYALFAVIYLALTQAGMNLGFALLIMLGAGLALPWLFTVAIVMVARELELTH